MGNRLTSATVCVERSFGAYAITLRAATLSSFEVNGSVARISPDRRFAMELRTQNCDRRLGRDGAVMIQPLGN
jgi:hypothetical protein